MRAVGELAPRVLEQASRPMVEGVGGHPLEVHLAVDLRAQEIVVGVVQSGKQRAVLDAVRLELLEASRLFHAFLDEDPDGNAEYVIISNTKAKKGFRVWHEIRSHARDDIGLTDVGNPIEVAKNGHS